MASEEDGVECMEKLEQPEEERERRKAAEVEGL